jgi:hypothetical protein
MQKNGFQRLYFNLETQGSIILGNFTNKWKFIVLI